VPIEHWPATPDRRYTAVNAFAKSAMRSSASSTPIEIRTRFGVNGIDVGLFCATPAVALTRNVSRKRAMEMLLTGEMIDARTALEFGLINRVADGPVAEAVNDLANVIAAKSPFAVKLGKQAVRAQAGLNLAEAYECASRAIVENMLAPDAQEGISAFLERRQP
jgi:enoyl-CoA hydratase/carnithine racemase